LIGLVTLLFFWPHFLLDQTVFAGDTAFVFVPFRHFLAQHLGSGLLPLWNPSLFGGTPALAESQYQVFYPSNLLLLVLGAARGMSWILAAHLAWMALGTFMFLRGSLHLSRAAALFGAIAFAFGATVQSRLSIPVYTDAAAWLPWILWGYDRGRTRGGAWLVAAPIALALQLCVGAAPYSYYCLALLLGYHLFCVRQERAPGKDGARRAWGVFVFTLGAGVALAMAQLAPELELALLSDRSTSANYEYAVNGSLTPRHWLLSSLFPKFFGLYWSAPIEGFMASHESGYLGAATLALLGAATATQQRKVFWFWTAAALVALFMAFGGNNPLYPLMFRYLPGTSSFRAPGGWLLITSFSGCMLAAMGLHALLEADNRRARQRALGVALTVFVAALFIAATPLGAPTFAVPQSPYGPWGQVLLFAVVALLVGIIKVPRIARVLKRPYIAGAFLSLLVIDLLAVSQDMEITQILSATDLETPPSTVARLKAASSAGAPERFWSEDPPSPLEPWQMGQALSHDDAPVFRVRQAMALRSLMPSCMPAQWNAPGLTGAWGALMPLRRHARPIYEADTSPELKRRWLHLLNARYQVSFGPPTQKDWETVSSGPPAIYRDPQALPRAFWVGSVVPATMKNALDLVNSPDFNPRQQVVLEMGSATLPTEPGGTPRDLRGATFSRYENGFVEMEIDAPSAGHLVLMDSFYPGWHARIDNKEVPIYPANYVGRAVPVRDGRQRVQMWFEPQSVRLGVFVSLLTLSLFAGVITQSRASRRNEVEKSAAETS
jgi:hypothetical protein